MLEAHVMLGRIMLPFGILFGASHKNKPAGLVVTDSAQETDTGQKFHYWKKVLALSSVTTLNIINLLFQL